MISKNVKSDFGCTSFVGNRTKNITDWKSQGSTTQSGQNSVDMVPECDSHWATSSPTTTASQSAHGSHLETTNSGSAYLGKKRHSSDATQQQQQLDEAQLVQIATEAFVRELGIEDETVLKDKVQIREVPVGTYLMKEESHKVFFLLCIYILYSSLLARLLRKLTEIYNYY